MKDQDIKKEEASEDSQLIKENECLKGIQNEATKESEIIKDTLE